MTTARFFAGGLLVALAAVCLVVLATAQSIPDEVRLVRPEVRLISPEEGEAIVQTAWSFVAACFPNPIARILCMPFILTPAWPMIMPKPQISSMALRLSGV